MVEPKKTAVITCGHRIVATLQYSKFYYVTVGGFFVG